ncbi:MAG TPA: TIGR03086 family metal-binding protein [Mycobacteriales bacterium]|jgi:uncharacterized protein (TIGR03086 family)|nr:TIGR03086 family metal-binding protein [Mycobacteriales bacterium]
MDDTALLQGVLDKTAGLVTGVTADDWDKPTPCPEYDVRTLLSHMVGWGGAFAAAANGRAPDADPSSYQLGEDPAGEFRAAADDIVRGWRDNGTDREVALGGPGLPGPMVLNMTLMECLGHGWDLAVATGQPMPYSDAEAQAVLDRAIGTLPDQYRGDGQAFGPAVAVPADAPAIDRFAGFMGRTP